MKKYTVLSLLFFTSFCAISQNNSDTIFNLLKTQGSPSSTLLGFSVSDIDKPSDVSALTLNLQSNTGGFSKLPSNYAVDFAPYWLFSKKSSYTTKEMASQKFNETFKQTLVLSIASLTPDSSYSFFKKGNSYLSLGFKFSIVRGSYSAKTSKVLNDIGDLQLKHIENIDTYFKSSLAKQKTVDSLSKAQTELAQRLDANNINPSTDTDYRNITTKIKTLNDEILAEAIKKDAEENTQSVGKELKTKAANLTLERTGWNWDIAGGISGEFVDKRFDSSYVHNAGLWSNLSYATEDRNTFLFLARYLYHPNKMYLPKNDSATLNFSTFDLGTRYVYTSKDSKLNIGVEAIYRNYLGEKKPEASWKILFNADYALYKNQKLNFSFGKDFDGVITKSGNLIAALSFIQGLGNNR